MHNLFSSLLGKHELLGGRGKCFFKSATLGLLQVHVLKKNETKSAFSPPFVHLHFIEKEDNCHSRCQFKRLLYPYRNLGENNIGETINILKKQKL